MWVQIPPAVPPRLGAILTYEIPVVRIPPFQPHPYADRLALVSILGNIVVVNPSQWKEGDLAVYIPPDYVLPAGTTWVPSGLQSDLKVRPKKIRGIYSWGLLLPLASTGVSGQEGDNLMQTLGITRFVDEIVSEWGVEPPFRDTPHYSLERWTSVRQPVFTESEEVFVTEKLHGQSARFTWAEGALWVGSRTQWIAPKAPMPQIACVTSWLIDLCRKHEGIVFYGETIGTQKGWRYEYTQNAPGVRLFDAFWSDSTTEPTTYRWLSFPEFQSIVPLEYQVPILYRGPYSEGLVESLAVGNTFTGYDPREGVVIRPVGDRSRPDLSRFVLKYISPAFLERS